jgi:AraC-like DNA-binding protein
LPHDQVGVTELHVIKPNGQLTDPMPRVDAYMVSLRLRDEIVSYWEEGRYVSEYSFRAGETTIYDLRRGPAAVISQPAHCLLFYMPAIALHALADQADVARISELQYPANVGFTDKTVWHLGLSLMPALRAPEQVSQLYMDSVLLGLATHIAQTYGAMQSLNKPFKGGLAPWQERLAMDLFASNLSGAMSLRDIAQACGLSVGHFSRAFHKSTGFAPHAWLLQSRVEAAKQLLRTRQRSLSEIAGACGFSDQSHFSRVFTRRVGFSPGAWRKIVAD